MRRIFIIAALTILGWWTAVAQDNPFPLPTIPNTLTTPTDRANYLALNFWESFPADDSSIVDRHDLTELAFANFLSIMPVVTQREQAFEHFLLKMQADKRVYDHMLDIAERYLLSPYSPMYDEELYIHHLQALLKSDFLPEIEKEYFRYQYSTVMKNRIGEVATNLNLRTKDGRREKLHKIKTEYTILCLSDPQCSDCNDVKRAIHLSSTINALLDEGRLTILYVCITDNEKEWLAATVPQRWINAYDDKGLISKRQAYDTATIPALYLLDARHRVVKKNSTVKSIEKLLSEKL